MPETWEAWPGGCRNFLDSLEPCKELQMWRNRVDFKVNRVFEVCLGYVSTAIFFMFCKAMAGRRALRSERPAGDVRGSLGRHAAHLGAGQGWLGGEAGRRSALRSPRFSLHVASISLQLARHFNGLSPSDASDGFSLYVSRPHWRTSRNWLHWDQNPWKCCDFEAVQGLLSLAGSGTSGGFVTVPGAHRSFQGLGAAAPGGESKEKEQGRRCPSRCHSRMSCRT